MHADPRRWLAVLRASQARLHTLVASLSPTDLRAQSYDTEWSVAQVLSHLGSQAEIFGLFLDAALRGEQPPGPEAFPPVWDVWNTRPPEEVALHSLATNDRFSARLDALSDETLSQPVTLFGMSMLIGDMARMRVSEHAVHSWDIAVAFDPDAAIAADAVALLIDMVPALAARAGKPQHPPFDLHVHTTDPERDFVLSVHDTVELRPFAGESCRGSLDLPAEALVRLVFGRLDAAHAAWLTLVSDEVDPDQLRRVFPGF
ncbi:MAG: maleylpyruvate isomerase N-terminal domain-containing protein [Acidimicrobiales bacterium]